MSTQSNIGAVVLIGLLVMSPLASIMVMPASALGGWNIPDDGNHEDDYNQTVSEYSSKLDAYKQAKTVETFIERDLTDAENSVYDAKNRGWLEAEQAFLQAYLDGDTQSQARQAGVEAMQSHYTTRQKNLIELQNNVVVSLYGIQNSSAHFSMPGDVQSMEYSIHTYDQYPAIQLYTTDHYLGYTDGEVTVSHQMSIDIVDVSSNPIELIDGTTKPATTFEFESPNSTWYGLTEQGNWLELKWDGSTELTYRSQSQYHLLEGETKIRLAPGSATDDDDSYTANISSIRSHLYPDDYPQETAKTNSITDPSRWKDVWSDYEQSYQSNVASYKTWANGSYQALENGTISADDVLSRLNQMELTADIDWQNATFNEGVVALSSMGLAAPGGSTAYMNISYQESFNGTMQTTQGMLMSQTNPPDGSWQTGLTYNSSQLDGAQVIMHLDGNQSSIKGDFVINEALTANGTTISDPNITVNQATYNTTNITALRQEVINLSERIGELRNRSLAMPGAGASFDFDGVSSALDNAMSGFVNSLTGIFGVGAQLVKAAVLVGLVLLALTLLSALS